jgi:hypothetical protein
MRKRWAVLVVEVVAVLVFSSVSFSQNHVPVMQDGKPAVLAQNPVPRTRSGKPDLSGLWNTPSTDEAKILTDRFGPVQREEPSLTPWATERFEYNRDTRPVPGYGGAATPTSDPKKFLASEGGGTFGGRPELNPFYKCLPPGTPYLITGLGGMSLAPLEIIQTDKRVLIIYEYDHTMRQIWTDGRKHPDPVDPTWVGHSIGTWDGDTLVVDTVGIRSENWLDSQGHVASPALHIIERYKRVDNDTMQIDFTYDDPKAFKKPWTQHLFRRLRPTWELIENDRCYPGSPELKAQEGTFNEMFLEH